MDRSQRPNQIVIATERVRNNKNMKRILTLLIVGLLQTTTAYAAKQDLLETFELALKNDPTYQEVRAQRDATIENRSQAIAQLLPSVTLQASSTWNYLHNHKFSGFQGAGTQTFYDSSATANINQPIFHWDYWVGLSQTENQILQAEAEYANALQGLMVRTITAYLNVLLAEDTLTFATAEKESLARQLEQAQQRFDVGLIAITDVLEAKAGYDGALSREIIAANDIDNAKEALREIIGENEADLLLLKEVIPLKKPDPLDIDQWNTTAENQNLSIISAFNNMEFNRKAIELQRSGHYPTVDFNASYTYQDTSSTFGLRGDTGTVGVQLNVPLFEGGAINSRVRQAKHNFDAARDNLVAVRRSITRQVKDAYRGVLSTISQVKALKATVVSQESALEATEAGFEVGTRTAVDVVNEQRNLFQARRGHSESRINYLLNWVQLKDSASSLTQGDMETLNSMLDGASSTDSEAVPTTP